MKKIKTLLILGAMLMIGLTLQSQTPSITYRFNNYHVVEATGPDTLIFDVEAKSNVATTFTTTFSIKINFNSAAFGTFAIPVSVQQLALTLPSGYNLNTLAASVTSSRFASTFQAFRLNPPFSGTYQTAYLSNLTTSYQGVARYKMLITGTGNLGVEFYVSGAGSMAIGNNYVLTSGGTSTTNYTPVVAENNLLLLPPDPTNYDLMITEVGDPSNSTTNFVEIYNAGDATVNFSGYAWYLNFNNSSSVQLTGTLAAGAKYTVAYDNVDFTPNIVSTNVGTGGTTNYLLSLYGDYSNGTAIDRYNGGTIGYAGKHAVRHYNIGAPNATFTPSEWVVSAAEKNDMTPGSHGSTLAWNGANTEWRLKANWTPGFIPDAGHNVTIGSGITPVISNGDNAYAHDLSIGSAGLVIESLPGGDGSLVTYGTVTGTASVQRYLGADRYWYVTKPVTSATANVFLHMWLFTYTGGAWTPFIYDETTPLGTMQGYAVWTSSINSYDPDIPPIGSTTRAYDGTPNTGPIGPYSLSTGWNFVGNPYPSAVDWNASGWTKTNLVSGGYVVWNGTQNAQYVGGVGTNGATKDIHAAQGFFVEANAGGSLGVTDAARLHSSQIFLKEEDVMQNLLRLAVSNGEISDETVIYFRDEASTGLDYDYDAHKFMYESVPQVYTMLDNEKMAISAFNNTTETPAVTMGINAPAEGSYTITASNIESFDASTPIYLEDQLTGQKINLRELGSYAFNSGEGLSERFVVHFTEYQGIGDKVNAEVNSIYAANQTVFVDLSANHGEIVIYNILGKEISRTSASNGLNLVQVPQGNAVYIVKVISDNNTVTKKVFVK